MCSKPFARFNARYLFPPPSLLLFNWWRLFLGGLFFFGMLRSQSLKRCYGTKSKRGQNADAWQGCSKKQGVF
jgi:hypothetical protein